MKKLALIFSFLFILMGCGGGGGGNTNKYAKITKSNFKKAIIAYKYTKDLNHIIFNLILNIPAKYSDSDGNHNCSMGGSYNVTTKSNTKVFKFNNCKISKITVLNGSIIKRKENDLTLKDFKFNIDENYICNGTITYYNLNNPSNLNMNINSIKIYNDKNQLNGEIKNDVYTIKSNYGSKPFIKYFKASINNIDTQNSGWIDIDTTKSLASDLFIGCPHDGEIRIKGESNYIDLKYRASLNVDVYFNNESSVLESYNSCNELGR